MNEPVRCSLCGRWMTRDRPVGKLEWKNDPKHGIRCVDEKDCKQAQRTRHLFVLRGK